MHAQSVAYARPSFVPVLAAPRLTRSTSATRKPNAFPGAAIPSRDSERLIGKRILVVEDDATVRTLVHRILVNTGYHVDCAVNGEEGWEALRQYPYDLMITDHEMPLLTGLDLIARLRHAAFSLPVILMSGAVVTASLANLDENQPSVFLQKPFSIDELVREVEHQLIAA